LTIDSQQLVSTVAFTDVANFKSALWERSGITEEIKQLRLLVDAYERVDRCIEERELLKDESQRLKTHFLQQANAIIEYEQQILVGDLRSRARKVQLCRRIQYIYKLQASVTTLSVTKEPASSVFDLVKLELSRINDGSGDVFGTSMFRYHRSYKLC
jgi:hypothetical protein